MLTEPALRVVLIYAHLLLCLLALFTVLRTDYRVVTRHISRRRLLQAHRHIVWLLTGLWLTGLAVVVVDLGPLGITISAMAERPKLVAKLLCVSVLTANGAALRYWSFPRLAAERRLSLREAALVMATGAISLTSWLLAAFYGIAKPLQQWPLAGTLGLYLGSVAVAVGAAFLLSPRLNTHRAPRISTALEQAAETLDFRVR